MASVAQIKTASALRVVTVTGSHLFKVSGYSLLKGIGIGKYVNSDIFTIGGYDWVIRYYSGGYTDKNKDFIDLTLS
jgi:speckle-type POZ protein